MNRKLLVVIFFTLSGVSLFGQTTDKEAILNMAKSETESYLKGNLEEWQSYRVKSNDASVTLVDNSGYTYLKSYDSINKVFVSIFKRMPKK